MDFKKLISKYPKMYLYYHDNGAWILYKQKPPKNTYVGEAVHDECILAEGSDDYMSDGYLPALVKDLCKALGIATESA